MPRTDAPPRKSSHAEPLVYSPIARGLHWTVALLVIATAPIGFVMVDRGARDIWDATTNNMYSAHKLIGLVILVLMIVRFTYRMSHGAPPSEPTLTAAQKGVSHAVHWSLYLLLILVPIGGYLGISYGNYLEIFGVNIPGIVAPNKEMGEKVLKIHGLAATAVVGLVALHLAGAFFHIFVKGDGVLARMWPGAGRKS